MKKYLSLFIILVMIDQITKEAIFKYTGGFIGYSINLLGDFLKLTYVENHGGVFGLFQGSIMLFTIAATIVISFLIYNEWKTFLNGDNFIKSSYVFIAAGAAGNMIDRIFRGFVIDMIDFSGIWQFIFNVADVYIHIGIYILIIRYFLKKKTEV